MTMKATKRARMRRKRATFGDMRRGPRGEVEMIELLAYTRNPLAPKIFVNDVGGIYKLHNGIWQVTFVQKYEGQSAATIEAIEQASLIWPERNWRDTGETFRWIFAELSKGTFRHDGPQRAGAH